jgi:NAD-dependent dihydropyrimidine dehydrogenase PreA subunit
MNRKEFIIGLSSSIGLLISIPIISPFISCEEKKKRTLVIDSEKCTGCKNCISICKHDAISIQNGKATIDPDICGGCGECAENCKNNAIS